MVRRYISVVSMRSFTAAAPSSHTMVSAARTGGRRRPDRGSVITETPPDRGEPGRMGGVSSLVRPEILAARSTAAPPAAPPPVVLDVRWRLGGPPGLTDYREGHLPGAVFLDLATVLAAPPGVGGRHPLPDPAALAGALGGAGVGDGSSVVVYDD